MTQTAGSVSSCLRVLGNKEVADLEKELILIFIYTTLLLSLPFLFFSDFQHFALTLVMSDLTFTQKPSSHLPADMCDICVSFITQCQTGSRANPLAVREASPHLDDLRWKGAFSARTRCFSGGLGNMWCYLAPYTS